MAEGERKGERKVFGWGKGRENRGGGVFSTDLPFKRKKFSPQFREKTREKGGREWV